MVGKIKKFLMIVAITFILALPIILSIFVPLVIINSLTYFMLYIFFCVLFISLSALLLIYSIFTKEARQILIPCAAVSSVLVIMFIIHIVINTALHSNESEFIIGANYNKFNSEKWKKATFSGSDSRMYMLKDLVEKILPDKNAEEIIELLGDPDGIISGDKKYYYRSLADNGEIIFRDKYKNESENEIFYDIVEKKSLYMSEIIKGGRLLYVTGSGLIDAKTLDIYFDENGIFQEYKLSAS